MADAAKRPTIGRLVTGPLWRTASIYLRNVRSAELEDLDLKNRQEIAAPDFLQRWAWERGESVPLTAIPPEGGRTETRNFGPDEEEACTAWIEERLNLNIYFAVNPIRAPLAKKASKADLVADVDVAGIGEVAQLLDLALELGDRLLEIQELTHPGDVPLAEQVRPRFFS